MHSLRITAKRIKHFCIFCIFCIFWVLCYFVPEHRKKVHKCRKANEKWMKIEESWSDTSGWINSASFSSFWRIGWRSWGKRRKSIFFFVCAYVETVNSSRVAGWSFVEFSVSFCVFLLHYYITWSVGKDFVFHYFLLFDFTQMEKYSFAISVIVFLHRKQNPSGGTARGKFWGCFKLFSYWK